jgi:hypothetical protein
MSFTRPGIAFSDLGECKLSEKYNIEDSFFKSNILDLSLMQAGVSDALETIQETVLNKIFEGICQSSPNLSVELFNTLFSIKDESNRDNAETLIDPWTFKIVHKKNRRGESGFGYTITERQLKYIYDYMSLLTSSGDHPRSPDHLPQITRSEALQLWSTEDDDVYSSLESYNDKVVARTIETIWQLQNYDGFVRQDNGFMREPRETGITAYAAKDTYEPLVDDSPVGAFEKTFIHKPWIIEVPVYKKPNTLDSYYGNGETEYRGVAWLMSNCRIPPTIRLFFLDTIRDIENTIVRLTDKFMATTKQVESRIHKRQKRRGTWLGAHRQRYIRGLLDETKRKIKDVDLADDKSLFDDIDTARFLARRFSGDIDRSNIEEQLRASVRSIYRDEIFADPDVGIKITCLPDSPSFIRYLVDTVVSLAENSARNYSSSDSSHNPYFYIEAFKNDKDTVKVTIRDNGDGLKDDEVDIINQMFDRYIESWQRGIFLSSDQTRWSTRLQALFGDGKIDPELQDKYMGWYGVISEIDANKIIDVAVQNFSGEEFSGLKVVIKLDII